MEGVDNSQCTMVVQGSGIPAANGIYERAETVIEGAPYYSKPGRWGGNEELFIIVRYTLNNGEKCWYISVSSSEDNDTDLYYVNVGYNMSVLPPKNKWKASRNNGVLPAPKVVPKPTVAAGQTCLNQTMELPETVASPTSSRQAVTTFNASLPQHAMCVSPNQAVAVVTSQTSTSQPTQTQVDTEQEGSNYLTGDEEESENDIASHHEEIKNDSGSDSDADRNFDAENGSESDSDTSGENESISDSEEEENSRKLPKKRTIKKSLSTNRKVSLNSYECWREFMDKLLEGGVDRYIDLPMIAVMGDTSSGKSSLLSNISLVELPSSDTLTTRCPIRLQMRHAESKWAEVKVAWKDVPEGATDDIHFEPKTVGEDNWSDITSIIAEAQTHIIQKSGKEVARDMVCIDMKGPHCENLTLIDLPGIVRSSGKGESATLADDIQALMNDYLKNERCVILAVHPCNVDFHNSQILAEARKVDPDTQRTIPVLTKPDLIDLGAESSVEQLLQGKKTESFHRGFHMVKGRGQKDLNEDMTIEMGLVKEEAFFRNNEPWRNTADKSKFGTKNLRVKLAELQMELIQSSFVSIMSEMKDERDRSVLELKELGEIPSDLIEKRSLFRRIREEIWNGLGAETLDGRISSLDANRMRPSAEFHIASKRFQDELSSSKLANVSSINVGTKVIAVVNDKEVRDEVCYVDEKNGHIYLKKKGIAEKNCVAHSTWKRVKAGHVIHTKSDKVVIERRKGTYDELQPIERKLVHSNPQWISELIEQNRPYSLPIFLNQDVFNAIVADRIDKDWSRPSMDLLDFTANLMESTAEEFIDGLGSIGSLPSLANYLIEKSSDVVESIKEDTKKEIEKLIRREQRPYTQNHYLFENVSKLRSERLMDEVLSTLDAHCGTGTEMQQISPANLHLAVRSVFERNQKKSVDEHMAEEMQNSLDGYGKVAFKRFVDNVPMICIGILENFPEKINEILFEVTDNEIEQLVAAPSGIVTKMNELKEEVKTLEKGISTIKVLTRSGLSI